MRWNIFFPHPLELFPPNFLGIAKDFGSELATALLRGGQRPVGGRAVAAHLGVAGQLIEDLRVDPQEVADNQEQQRADAARSHGSRTHPPPVFKVLTFFALFPIHDAHLLVIVGGGSVESVERLSRSGRFWR